MATETFTYPEEHTRLFADIIAAGMVAIEGDERLTLPIINDISDHLDEMYAYADRMGFQ